MPMTSLTPNLVVDDVAATVDYYRDVLGFEFQIGVIEGTEDPAFEATGQPLGFAIVKRGDVEIMFQSPASVAADLGDFRPGSGDVVALYVAVDEVDALHDELVGRANVVVPLRDTFYGAREFHIRDCNDVLVGFARQPRRD